MTLSTSLQEQIQGLYDRVRQAIPDSRRRFGQRQMIASVARGLHSASIPDRQPGQNIIVVEGKTGVGKTVGYLVPSLLMARSQKKKLVLSTGTVSLQEQLFNRDLPAVAAQVETPPTFSLSKGRSRYICPMRLKRLIDGESTQDLFGDAAWTKRPSTQDIDTLRNLDASLCTQGWDGSKDTCAEGIAEDLWGILSTDSSGCTKKRCGHFKECPYYKARATLQGADVIVANHDLVLSVLSSESSLLPPPSECIYVFDEGHHLPSCAVERFSVSASVFGSIRWLDKLPFAVAKVLAIVPSPAADAHLASCAESLVTSLETIGAGVRHVMDESGAPYLRFGHGTLSESIQIHADQISTQAKALYEGMKTLGESICTFQEQEPERAKALDPHLSDFNVLLVRCAHLSDVWSRFTGIRPDGVPPFGKWISVEAAGKGVDYHIHVAPVTAAEVLSKHLWDVAAGVVLTSATITSLGSFDYFLRQAGLDRYSGVRCESVASPFDYEAQGALVIPRMYSDPGNQEAHTNEICDLIPNELRAVRHGCLTLFSSKKRMLAVYETLEEALKRLVLVQGSCPRQELLQRHRERVNEGIPSIIFGLASFGEGLDLPGALCESVLIDKIPFPPPDSPLEEAMAEWIRAQGMDPFQYITLPKAGLMLIQWAGRLIRCEDDKGRVVIYDRRLVTKSYGAKLIDGLPPFSRAQQ